MATTGGISSGTTKVEQNPDGSTSTYIIYDTGQRKLLSTQPAKTGVTSVSGAQQAVSGGGTGSSYSVSPSGSVGYTATAPTPMVNTQTFSTGGGQSGSGQVTQDAYQSQQQTQLEAQLRTQQMQQAAQLQAAAEARRLGYLSTVQSQQPTISRGGLATDEQGARDAAFARAKDQASSTAASSVRALQEVMAGRGLTGSSMETAKMGDTIAGAQGSMDEFTRDGLMLDLNRAAELSDQDYQGKITQRGQNLSMVPSLMGLITASNGLY